MHVFLVIFDITEMATMRTNFVTSGKFFKTKIPIFNIKGDLHDKL
jgi:hypothetical protein